MGAEQVTCLLILYTPGGNEHVLRILWIDGDVVENVIVAAAQMSKATPVMSTICR